jgi:Protein of unknown function (DUF1232)
MIVAAGLVSVDRVSVPIDLIPDFVPVVGYADTGLVSSPVSRRSYAGTEDPTSELLGGGSNWGCTTAPGARPVPSMSTATASRIGFHDGLD